MPGLERHNGMPVTAVDLGDGPNKGTCLRQLDRRAQRRSRRVRGRLARWRPHVVGAGARERRWEGRGADCSRGWPSIRSDGSLNVVFHDRRGLQRQDDGRDPGAERRRREDVREPQAAGAGLRLLRPRARSSATTMASTPTAAGWSPCFRCLTADGPAEGAGRRRDDFAQVRRNCGDRSTFATRGLSPFCGGAVVAICWWLVAGRGAGATPQPRARVSVARAAADGRGQARGRRLLARPTASASCSRASASRATRSTRSTSLDLDDRRQTSASRLAIGKTTCAFFRAGQRSDSVRLHASRSRSRRSSRTTSSRFARPARSAATRGTTTRRWRSTPYAEKTGALARLTNARGYDAEASYSPDGQWIAFSSMRNAYNRTLSDAEKKQLDDRSELLRRHLHHAARTAPSRSG